MNEEELFQNLRALEAILLTSQDLVTENDLKIFFPPETDIGLLLEHLQQHYQARGIVVVKRGNGWGLRTAPDLAERLEIRKVEIKPMSRAAIETIAIIAYHQPVTRAEIEQIRGVSIGKNIFEFLVAENLIKPGKRREVAGRPLTWITTQHFLDAFSLESLKELPNLQELKDTGLLSMAPPQLDGVQQHTLPLALEDSDTNEDEASQDIDDTGYDDFETAMEQQDNKGEAA